MSMLGSVVGLLLSWGAQGGADKPLAFAVTVPPQGASGTPRTVDLRAGHELTAAEAEALGDQPVAWLEVKGERARAVAAEWVSGAPKLLRVRWLEGPAAATLRLHSGSRPVRPVGFPKVVPTVVARLGEGEREIADTEGQLLLRHVRGYDAARHADTCRPYWHVLAGGGEPLLLTKGLGGRYPHHRGLYAGWNKVERDGKSHDFWHCPKGETLRHVADLTDRELLAEGYARLVTLCEWVQAGEGFVREETTLELWLPASGNATGAGVDKVIDVTLRLEAIGASVRLGGDAHHAGLHFRAAIAADEQRARARFARSPGAADRGNDVWVDSDWVAYAFVLGGDRQAEVVLLDHPDNPRPSQLSTRDYGRIGFFRRLLLEPGQPVVLRARLVVLAPRAVAAGEAAAPSAGLAARLWQDYVAPPRVVLERAR